MTITKRYQLGICLFIIWAIVVTLTVTIASTFTNPALTCTTIVIGLIAAIYLLCQSIYKTFKEDQGLDYTPLNEPIKIKLPMHKVIVPIAVIICGFILYSPTKPMIRMYNTNIGYTNKLKNVLQERKMFYDKMWKTYLAKNDICQVNRKTFIEVTNIIMNGRADGQNISWKFVSENQNIPYNEFTTFYKDLSNFVTEQRESYYQLENEAMKIVQHQNGMLDSFPNNMYNKILGIEKLYYTPGFTSARTEEVFKNHKE